MIEIDALKKDLLEFLDKRTNENANAALKRLRNPSTINAKRKNVRKTQV